MKHRIPQYLNEQVMFIGMHSDEFCLLILAVYLSAIAGFHWLVLMGNAVLMAAFIWVNRNFPRGFVRHIAYFSGFYQFKKYPEYFANRFIE